MKEYQRLLTQFDPEFNISDLSDAEFHGDGMSADCLGCYRMGKLSGRPAFEKIYKTGSLSLLKTIWLYNEILPEMTERPRLPELLHISEGQRLTAVYSSFIEDFKPVSEDALLKELFLFCDMAFRNQVKTGVTPLSDFRNQQIYINARKRLKKIVSRSGRNEAYQHALEEFISDAVFPKHLSHGDLSVFNVDKSGSFIDWDMCGYSPIGYDIAIVMHKAMPFQAMSEVEEFVNGYTDLYGDQIRLSLFYLAAVFYCRRLPGGCVNDALILEIFDAAVAELGRSQPRKPPV